MIFAFEVNKMSERPFWAKFQLILFPIVAFESLSDLIRDRLQESIGQHSLENHLMLLEALIKHWRGEILSVGVTRVAQNCKSSWILTFTPIIQWRSTRLLQNIKRSFFSVLNLLVYSR